METIELLLVVMILVLLAEVTYLVAKLPRQSIGKKQGRPILLDTSVLIDGRIIAIAKSGFVGDTLVVPRSVVGELQFLADNADHEKRARARYGLDVVSDLQSIPHVTVEIFQDGSKAEEGVDERLLSLAKKYNAAVCTIDYNLNKVAVVEGITVLNVNELAQSLRMAHLPGERMVLELVQKGQDAHQGVGYLSDGTMVVVEHASKHIGQSVEIEFIRSLQTAAGKMMFARRVEKDSLPPNNRPAGKKPQKQVTNKQSSTQNQSRIPQEVTKGEPPAKSMSIEKSAPAAVYHSDVNDRRTNEKKRTGQSRPAARPAKRAPRSSDREATLIDLVEKQ